MDEQKAKDLLQRYRAGQVTEEEKKWLEEWGRKLSQDGDDWEWREGEKEKLADDLETLLFSRIRTSTNAPVTAIPLRWSPKNWMKYAAAIIAISASCIYYFNSRPSVVSAKKEQEIPAPADISPGANKAMLTLADGSVIVLDSTVSGPLADQGNVKLVRNADGHLEYRASQRKEQETRYNTLSVPNGSAIVFLTLADNSRVWINAGSTLRYPVAFTDSERKVELNGEAYFEVAKNQRMPFIVMKKDMSVQVLGTHFNLKAYDNETLAHITLLEGSVNVSRGNAHTLLAPGQQAQVRNEGPIALIRNADTEAAMAWKKGYFQLERTGIEELMRQIARWYDVEVTYEGAIPARRFAGQMKRNLNLSKTLRILEESNVHFRIEGKRVWIRP